MSSDEDIEVQILKEEKAKIDRELRALYKAVVRNVNSMKESGNWTDDEMRTEIHEKIDKYFNAVIQEREILFPVNNEYDEQE